MFGMGGNPYMGGGGMTLADLMKQNQIGGHSESGGDGMGGMGMLLGPLGQLLMQHPLAAISPGGYLLSKLFK